MNSPVTEIDKLKERYQRRRIGDTMVSNRAYVVFMVKEREAVFSKIIKRYFSDSTNIEILEIGAGGGGNIHFFKKTGIDPGFIHANELLDDRLRALYTAHPDINIHPGNALDLPFEKRFDLVFQSTVFTSILDATFKKELAEKMWIMLRPGGIILWYDFVFNNPSNPDVKGVPVAEVEKLFGKANEVWKVTLAPPIARRTGRFYTLVNSMFPFLRTHRIIVIKKPNEE